MNDSHYSESPDDWQKRMGLKPRKEKNIDNPYQRLINEEEEAKND